MGFFQILGRMFSGDSIDIVGGRVIIDGNEVDIEGLTGTDTRKVVIVVKNGDIGSLRTDGSVSCADVKGDIVAGGSVNCDDIGGDLKSSGSVNCGDVGGSVEAGGSVNADCIDGSVKAGGSVRYG